MYKLIIQKKIDTFKKQTKTLSQTVNIKKSSTMELLSQRSAKTLTRFEKKDKKEEPAVTPFRKYTIESKSQNEKIKKAISATKINPKASKIEKKNTTDKIIENELQRLVTVNMNILISTINEKVKNEYESHRNKVEEFLSILYESKIKNIEEVRKNYESDVRRLEPFLDACISK
jgi:hypothetical protein